ncbi:PQ loop repeat-domain-containing protein [Gilbertella persicaria]|uniref:PQ loop repeat-domain-containing protein n=1 Tax=Gilbertella persicaria TaxID=101096 RepID=UPI00221EB1AC|nr:PQ loop repeat-domain-containing protein [Gilbertella persicaria]KAI8072253.1 PQ loop repeat-domain-containing protein [Gilbertella persicaria]
MSIGSTISSLIGWCYFVAWSFSFYPQTILNWKRKSVQGLSIDFLCYNVYGFLCYWIYNMSFFFSHEIQDEYKQRNPESNGSLVRFNDVVFAMHAFLVSSFTLMQTFYYKRDNDQTVSSVAKYFFVVTGIGIIGFLFVISINKAWWIDLLYYLSFIKMAVSLIKYMPQVWINYKRKSTVGWSIHNILLDFTGGVLSISQLFLDASLNGDWSGVSGNPVKFGLGLQSIVFDVVFMMQHYILYRENNDKSDEEETRQLMDEEQE